MAAKKSETKGKNNSRYARYFCLIKGREHLIDKDDIVMQFTEGRTTHMSEMTNAEFHEMCDAIEGRFNRSVYEQQLKKSRSAVLLRIGRLGINTIDNWDEVNAFLLSPKIAGKLLYEMSVEEMKALVKKLEAILRNGGLKSIKEAEDAKSREQLNNILIPVSKTTNKPKYLS